MSQLPRFRIALCLFIALPCIVMLSGCIKGNAFRIPKNLEQQSAPHYWVYLCGLTSDFYSKEEVANRKTLDRIGSKLNIQFIYGEPFNRSPQFDNKLHWPHNTPQETLQTYKQIMNSVGSRTIDGFIGFSNGGFFLNQLVQLVPLHKPVLSIGSAGLFNGTSIHNSLYLLIGTQDYYHYNYAHSFYDKAKNSSLNIHIIDYEGGHELPVSLLEKIIAKGYTL